MTAETTERAGNRPDPRATGSAPDTERPGAAENQKTGPEELSTETRAAIIQAAAEIHRLDDRFTAADIRRALKEQGGRRAPAPTAEEINGTLINAGIYGHYTTHGNRVIFCDPEYVHVREQHNHRRAKGDGIRAKDYEQARRNRERHAAALMKHYERLEREQAEQGPATLETLK